MAHSPYHFDWNVTPSGLEPPASTESPTQFLKEFANINVKNLDPSEEIFLPGMGQMQQNIAMSRFGLGNTMAAQRLAGTNSLMDMTSGMGVNSMGGGFGKRQSSITQGFRDFNQQQQAQLQQNIANYRADVLGEQYRTQDALTTALGNLIQSGESNVSVSPSGPNPSFTSRPTNYQGDTIEVNGIKFNWDGTQYSPDLGSLSTIGVSYDLGTGG